MGRIGLAFRCFFSVLGGKPLPDEALPTAKPLPALPAAKADPAKEAARAIQMLGLLQKEGRLIDFLLEDIGDYDDAQVGAAVRNIHRDCRKALEEHLSLEAVLAGQEDGEIQVEVGFDPSRIRLVGNVTGEPPFSGILRHKGWRASATQLPELPKEGDLAVIAPAEVELG